MPAGIYCGFKEAGDGRYPLHTIFGDVKYAAPLHSEYEKTTDFYAQPGILRSDRSVIPPVGCVDTEYGGVKWPRQRRNLSSFN